MKVNIRCICAAIGTLLTLNFGCAQTDHHAETHQDDSAEMSSAHVEYAGDGPADTTLVNLNGTKQVVIYHAVGDKAVVEGDIVIGSITEAKANKSRPGDDRGTKGITIVGPEYRWPNKTVFYSIDSNLPDSPRVIQAIADWNESTTLKFVERTDEANYIYFTTGNGCSSFVGMRGGRQDIVLGAGCQRGHVIHEIGHAVGLWHEQSRSDRDEYVVVVWDNIHPDWRHNFDQQIHAGDDRGGYDYCSIMHYPIAAFAVDPNRPTIVPKTPLLDCTMGQRDHLSAGDIAAVKEMYP